jgi:hypothetical protein
VKDRLLESARRLHEYLLDRCWSGGALRGPTPGVRWNLKLWRFVKAYMPALPWGDAIVSYQGQGYWIIGNWLLHRITGEDRYGETALACSRFVIDSQRPDGSWPNPIPERRHLVTNIEGLWAGAGLLATYKRAGDEACLESAKAWWNFLEKNIGYQEHAQGAAAVNYFDTPRGKVPNNSTAAMWFLSELADATGDPDYHDRSRQMLSFLSDVQKESGEMPYELPGEGYPRSIPHYQCFQYNAFQLIDLYHFWKRTGCEAARTVAAKLAEFLAGGVTASGACRYSCGSELPRVIYHAHTLAYALSCASHWGLDDYTELSTRGYKWTLEQQRPDGSFPFSKRDYLVLSDSRVYPANLAMAVCHLADEAGEEQ